MLYFKTCPKCKGDMQLTRDMYGSYKACLQCGYLEDLEAESAKVPRVKAA